jgi:hypothetical protein
MLTTFAPLIQPGIIPYAFGPEVTSFSIDGNAKEISISNADLTIEATNLDIAITRQQMVTLEALNKTNIFNYDNKIRTLYNGSKIDLLYDDSTILEISIASVSINNASATIYRNNDGSSSINVTKYGNMQIVASYDPKGDIIPVWLSHGTEVELSNTDVQYGWLYLDPQDYSQFQELVKLTINGDTIENPVLQTRSELKSVITFTGLIANSVNGTVLARSPIEGMHGNDNIKIRAQSGNGFVASSAVSSSTFTINTPQINGQLWINNVPTPESFNETILRSSISGGVALLILVFGMLLERTLFESKVKDIHSSNTPTTSKTTEVKEKDQASNKKSREIEYIDGVQAYLFFPPNIPEYTKTLDYHRNHHEKRLIVNLKTVPQEAFYLTPESFGWKFIQKYPERWISETVDSTLLERSNFTKMWCKKKGFKLNPWVAEKNDLVIEKEST